MLGFGPNKGHSTQSKGRKLEAKINEMCNFLGSSSALHFQIENACAPAICADLVANGNPFAPNFLGPQSTQLTKLALSPKRDKFSVVNRLHKISRLQVNNFTCSINSVRELAKKFCGACHGKTNSTYRRARGSRSYDQALRKIGRQPTLLHDSRSSCDLVGCTDS